MHAIWTRVLLFMTLLLLWLFLVGPPSSQEMAAGAGVALLLALVPLPGASVYGEFSLMPKKVLYALRFLVYFLVAVVKSNLDVAFRVLSPRLPINPGIVRVKTSLTSSLGRLILANSITLTPGTITVDIQGENLFIHWINIQAADIEEATRKIVTDFERRLEVIFG